MINVGIIGHTGRLGIPLVELLNKHPYAKIVYTESRKEGIKGNLSDVELVFLALPHGESKKYILELGGKRIIDLSVDHRSEERWVYGLSELNKDKIKGAERIANPGCYATSIILGLAPLKGNLEEISISSIRGISGAGLDVEKEDNFKSYHEGKTHPQIREIEEILEQDILFFPKRIDTADRGIVSTIFTKYTEDKDLGKLYREFYKNEPFIRIVDKLETKNVNKTNFCDIKISKHKDKLVVISALDNLIKGGAGQAVQNFNIMYGFDENLGLV